ncbi:5'-3' exonuclease [Bacillus alkalicellulosilyticus]|uniref:5'-3' exonuclease n=1 Tax=Alkalihalobacterium alkalicellulosilyticum TaxID=1912214 RepID=UPI000997D3FD|nr:5'-3' exonuclease H3TH domain-containing protein [Bacillus alkalicellulosilyticus]
MEKQSLLLIDGFNLLSRGYFATAYGKSEEELTKNSQGQYTNALRVFFQKLFNLIGEHGITHVAVAWDVKREETERRIKYDFYKATRGELPDPLIQQYETCTAILEELGIYQLVTPPYEADDAIGTVATLWTKQQDRSCYIYSNDRDLLQLLSDQTSQIIASKKGETIYSLAHFKEDYAIDPMQWVDVKALLGDKSDNIPGCPGVGEKSALPLIQQYGTIEKLYEELEALDPKYNRYKKKLEAGRETAMISKELAKIVCDIPDLHELSFDTFCYQPEHPVAQDVFSKTELKIKLY